MLRSFCFLLQIACRYDKGEWSKCVNGSMSRKDNVRTGSDASCKATREITKNCNKDKKQKNKEKSECIILNHNEKKKKKL